MKKNHFTRHQLQTQESIIDLNLRKQESVERNKTESRRRSDVMLANQPNDLAIDKVVVSQS